MCIHTRVGIQGPLLTDVRRPALCAYNIPGLHSTIQIDLKRGALDRTNTKACASFKVDLNYRVRAQAGLGSSGGYVHSHGV